MSEPPNQRDAIGQLLNSNVSLATWRSVRLPIRLAFGLFAVGALLAAQQLLIPVPNAHWLWAFVAAHGAVCLWASGSAFARSEGPLHGCGLGIVLWVLFSFESWFLVALWGQSLPPTAALSA
jgi:hypothetical protein